ncbi:hypothetical protein HPP92_024347 [Vanilla planifolia]|uniref:DUF4378 domain-containing protein n=1 Tax=Vanilla planifolia TaxID=51239 RepID=A0A835PMA6_VANPL|nr:hypothetical protein HPP92_024347 [Vanilla planifolia]
MSPLEEKKFEGHMGCMAGFLQLFDRPYFVTGKRCYFSNGAPILSASGSTSASESSEVSTVSLETNSAEENALRFPVFELIDGVNTPWKFKEAPRLSLDGRTIVDAKGNLNPREIPAKRVASEQGEVLEKKRRSPSVVARLMGLEVLPCTGVEPPKRAELRRSVSESQIRFQKPSSKTLDDISWPQKLHYSGTMAQERDLNADIVGSFYGEIEKRLRMRGIQEPARDLQKLKQILEVLQLKGLLHSKSTEKATGPLQSVAACRSPIVLMKPIPAHRPRLTRTEAPTLLSTSIPPRRRPPPARSIPSNSVPHDRRMQRSPEPVKAPTSPSGSPMRRRQLTVECQKNACPQRRIQTVNFPEESNSTAEMQSKIDEVCSPAAVNKTTSASQPNFESEMMQTRRKLLERCDKLLHNIAAFTSSADKVIAAEQHASPVSVLHPSLPDDRCPVDLKDGSADREDDHGVRVEPVRWIVLSDSIDGSHEESGSDNGESDYAYVRSVLLESSRHLSAADAFAAVEKRHHSSSSPSPLHRRLVFDAVREIVERKRDSSLRKVWDELSRFREGTAAVEGDVMEVARKDLLTSAKAGGEGWEVARWDEMSQAALRIERLVFKDLVVETIREMANLAGRINRWTPPRRKLWF